MKTKQFLLIVLACLCIPFTQLWSNPVNGLLERIDPGASKKFIIQVKKGPSDFFELDQKGDKVVIRGNNYVNIATGLNWYLKYYAGIHLSWNGMTAELPESLPKVSTPVRKETNLSLRTISTIALIPIPWLSGTGNAGKRKSTGWHCTESTCHWQ